MRGFSCVIVVACAVMAFLVCSPSGASEQRQNKSETTLLAAQKAPEAAAQKSAQAPATVPGGRACVNAVCAAPVVVVYKAKITDNHVASACKQKRLCRPGVRLLCFRVCSR